MSFVQTTYSENMAAAVPGMPADADFSADSRTVETEAGIGFGLAVSQGTADKGALLGAAAATGFVGVTIRDKGVVNASNADKYNEGDTAAVMTRGDIWVTVAAAVEAGDDVTFSSTTGALSSVAADGTNFAITGARWMTSAAQNGLAILRLGGALPSA